MDLFSAPIEHKNQACFVAPQFTTNLQLKTNFLNTFKDKNTTINHSNHHHQNEQQPMRSIVQKLSLHEQQQQQQQQQNNDYEHQQQQQQQQQQTTNYYDPNLVKIENDNHDYPDHNRTNGLSNGNNHILNLDTLRFKVNNSYNFNEINPTDHQNSSSFNNFSVNLNSYNLNGINGLSNLSNLSNLNNLTNVTKSISKRGSGRRPSNLKDDKLSPEEEERRRLRRERNKEAAARCRKRRVEHTNTLEKETQNLEESKHFLQKEIEKLKLESKHLVALFQNHDCKIPAKMLN